MSDDTKGSEAIIAYYADRIKRLQSEILSLDMFFDLEKCKFSDWVVEVVNKAKEKPAEPGAASREGEKLTYSAK